MNRNGVHWTMLDRLRWAAAGIAAEVGFFLLGILPQAICAAVLALAALWLLPLVGLQ